MLYLKQSTSVDVAIGPFLDETDGKTAETALTITQPDIRLKKNGGAWAQKNAAQTLSHEEAGWYEVTLDSTDTNTLGHLIVAVHESGALPVWKEFTVLPANVYDSLVSGSDYLQVDAIQVEGSDATNQINAEVVDCLNVDTYSELTSLPGASPTVKQMLMFLYMMARNKLTTTSTQMKIHRDDATTVLGTYAVSDDSTTFTRGEIA